MTPLASQEPYRNGTPVMPMTPMQSPIYTAPSSPGTQASELSEKELQTKTRRDIMLSATRLGKQNIASWAGKDYDDKDVSVLVKTKASLHACKSVSEARASAWEKAKKANYIDGYSKLRCLVIVLLENFRT